METKKYIISKEMLNMQNVKDLNTEIDSVLNTNVRFAEMEGKKVVEILYPIGLDEFDGTHIIFRKMNGEEYRVKRGFQVIYKLMNILMKEHKTFPIIITIDKELMISVERTERNSEIVLKQKRK